MFSHTYGPKIIKCLIDRQDYPCKSLISLQVDILILIRRWFTAGGRGGEVNPFPFGERARVGGNATRIILYGSLFSLLHLDSGMAFIFLLAIWG